MDQLIKRRCERCHVGTEECVIGNMWICSLCDEDAPEEKDEPIMLIADDLDWQSYADEFGRADTQPYTDNPFDPV